jgi:hypothetical protein
MTKILLGRSSLTLKIVLTKFARRSKHPVCSNTSSHLQIKNSMPEYCGSGIFVISNHRGLQDRLSFYPFYVCHLIVRLSRFADLSGVACYMPKEDNSSVLPSVSSSQLVTLRRAFLSHTLKLLQPVMIGEIDPSFDDAITFFILSSIGASENDNHVRLPHWLSFMKYALRKLNLYTEIEGLDEETREERRRYVLFLVDALMLNRDFLRLWWSGYTIDRHVALSFNLRPQTTDLECELLQRPCPDAVWESDASLQEYFETERPKFPRGIIYSVQSLDLFGVLLPLSRYARCCPELYRQS